MAEMKSFAARLHDELDLIEDRFASLLGRSEIRDIDPNRRYPNSGVAYLGYPSWGWVPDEGLVGERTRLLADFEEWASLFRLLHRSPVTETQTRIDNATGLIRKWLSRDHGDHSVPGAIEKARAKARSSFDELTRLIELGTHGEGGILVIPDTNVLLRSPDVSAYSQLVGSPDFMAVLLTTVVSELDALKDRGRTPDVRDNAARALRRIKGLRDRGDLRTGVRVDGVIQAIVFLDGKASLQEALGPLIEDWADTQRKDPDVAEALRVRAEREAKHSGKVTPLLSRQDRKR